MKITIENIDYQELSINEIDIIEYGKLKIDEKINFFTNKILKILENIKNKSYAYFMTDPEIELIRNNKEKISKIIEDKGWKVIYKNDSKLWDVLEFKKLNN